MNWLKLNALSIALAILIPLTSIGCSSQALKPTKLRPPILLKVHLDDWAVSQEDAFLPAKDLRSILVNRLRWIAYAKALENWAGE